MRTPLRSHISYKTCEKDGWLGSRPLTAGDSVDRSPTAAQRADGSIWLFWAGYTGASGPLVPAIRLQMLAAGRVALPARVQGTALGPFAVADGDQFRIIITSAGKTFNLAVTPVAEDFSSRPRERGCAAAVLTANCLM
jgi:hypothetical protein